MTPVSIQEFVKQTVKNNPGMKADELTESCKAVLNDKKSGAACTICGAPIWAAGSAITGNYMCFTCMTGEMDDSEDYEIKL